MADIQLPRKPVYKMFYDGKDLKRIISWLQKFQGDLGEVDLGNPELQGILVSIIDRIQTLETAINALPDLGTLVSKVSTLESTSTTHGNKITTVESNLNSLADDVDELETSLTSLTTRVTTLEGKECEETDLTEINSTLDTIAEKILALETAMEELGDIYPITNGRIEEILTEIELG